MAISVAPASKMTSFDNVGNDKEQKPGPFHEQFADGVGLAGIHHVCGVSVHVIRR